MASRSAFSDMGALFARECGVTVLNEFEDASTHYPAKCLWEDAA